MEKNLHEISQELEIISYAIRCDRSEDDSTEEMIEYEKVINITSEWAIFSLVGQMSLNSSFIFFNSLFFLNKFSQ